MEERNTLSISVCVLNLQIFPSPQCSKNIRSLYQGGHDIKLHPHRVKLYRMGCLGSGLLLAKALS